MVLENILNFSGPSKCKSSQGLSFFICEIKGWNDILKTRVTMYDLISCAQFSSAFRYGKSGKCQINMRCSLAFNWEQTSKPMMDLWLGRKTNKAKEASFCESQNLVSPICKSLAWAHPSVVRLCDMFSLIAVKMALLLMSRKIETLPIGFYSLLSEEMLL